uniref:Aromatic amino acid beta-eliminating lyase/threonine aldolase domain-containing protein n=1 Tax=Ascaris suum TaxID=6253 RepID=F1L6X8_ASCSU
MFARNCSSMRLACILRVASRSGCSHLFLRNSLLMYSTCLQSLNSDKLADFRSDTVTKPCSGMRQAMFDALVGDDVYEEDPTVNELERKCAELFGKESALFVASGTMGNLLSIMSHTERGDEIIVGRTSHLHRWEQGNYARLAGVSATTVPVLDDGTLPLDEIELAIRVDDIHMPRTRVICIENTHNYAGGKSIPLEYLKEIRKLADVHNLLVHVDGARFYNAAVDLGVSIAELAQPADSVTMCFSKGLGAPIGSIIVGNADFIHRCRRHRKSVGGGWRQAGVLAAAAIYALEHASTTVSNDHHNAQYLCKLLNEVTPRDKSDILFAKSATNMVLLTVLPPFCPGDMAKMLKERGILVMPIDEKRIRIVLNNGVGKTDIDKLVSAYAEYMNSTPKAD